MSDAVSIRAQAEAVELDAVNLKGTTDVLRELVRKGKRQPSEVAQKERYLPHLFAAAKTLRWLEANEVKIRAALGEAAEPRRDDLMAGLE